MFSLLSDEGRRVLWKWAHLPQGGLTVHEALETVNLCLPFITFFPLFSVFKFQFQISPVLSFISFRDGVIYTSSLDSFSSDASLGYLLTSWRASPALLKGSAMTHQNPHFDEIKANVFFFFFFFFLLSLLNSPLPSLIQCPQTHLILSNTRSKGVLSPCWHHKYGLLWKVWHPCLNSLIPHLCQDEMFFPRMWDKQKEVICSIFYALLLPSAARWAIKHAKCASSHPWNVKST